jgi:hypothetical protein
MSNDDPQKIEAMRKELEQYKRKERHGAIQDVLRKVGADPGMLEVAALFLDQPGGVEPAEWEGAYYLNLYGRRVLWNEDSARDWLETRDGESFKPRTQEPEPKPPMRQGRPQELGWVREVSRQLGDTFKPPPRPSDPPRSEGPLTDPKQIALAALKKLG